jgi:hypothetical protein
MKPAVTAAGGTSGNYLQRAPSPSGLAAVLDVILDKGLVIDAYVRVSVIGIELVTIDARIVVASVDTYLRFAEAVNRLDLTETQVGGLPELVEIAAAEKTKSTIDDVISTGSGSALRGAARSAATAAKSITQLRKGGAGRKIRGAVEGAKEALTPG